jgi:hypothetical protein
MEFLEKKMFHCRGVRQGDPLSPLLFILAMEPFHRMFQKALQLGLLSKLSKSCDMFKMSLYADDAAVFIKPAEQDLHVTLEIMNIFAQASGLLTYQKMSATQFSATRLIWVSLQVPI